MESLNGGVHRALPIEKRDWMVAIPCSPREMKVRLHLRLNNMCIRFVSCWVSERNAEGWPLFSKKNEILSAGSDESCPDTYSRPGVLRLSRIQNSMFASNEHRPELLQLEDIETYFNSKEKDSNLVGDSDNPNFTLSEVSDDEISAELKDAHAATQLYLEQIGFSPQDAIIMSNNAPRFMEDILQRALEEEEAEKLFELTSNSAFNSSQSSTSTNTQNEFVPSENMSTDNSFSFASNSQFIPDPLSQEGDYSEVPGVSEKKSEQEVSPMLNSLNRIEPTQRFRTPMGVRILNLLPSMNHRISILCFESIGIRKLDIFRVSKFVERKPITEVFEIVNYLKSILEQVDPKHGAVSERLVHMRKNFDLNPNLIDEDLDQVFSFMQRLEAQRGGISQLDYASTALPRLIESFPSILNRDLQADLIPIISHLRENWGVSEHHLGRIILCFPPLLLFTSSQTLLDCKRTLKQYDIRVKYIGNALAKYPWLLSSTIMDRLPKVCEFLISHKLSITRASDMITRYPNLLGKCVDPSLTSSISSLNSMGVYSKRLAKILFESPNLLLRSYQDLDKVRSWLIELGLSYERISHVLLKCPMVFSSSIPDCLDKKIQFLESLGLKPHQISRIVSFFPKMLTMDVLSMQNKLDYLMGKGISKHEIAFMVYRFPPLLGYSIDFCLKPKLDYLLHEMGHSIHNVVSFPKYFSYSLDKRIKPRATVLRNRSQYCDLKTMLTISDDEFAQKFFGMEQMFLPMYE